MLRYVLVLMILFTTAVRAHEMVPTYPKLEPSFMTGLQKVTMTMFTSDWNPIPFVSQFKVYKIPYLSTVTFDIFIRDEDKSNVTYICSQSKLRKTIETRTAVSSRICSKVKRNVLK